MAEYMIQGETLTAIADAIRGKTGGASPIDPAQMAAEISNISAGGGLPAGISAVSVGTYTPASETTSSAKIPHGLGDVPNFVVMYADGLVTSADFATYICAFAGIPQLLEAGVGVRMYRHGSANGSSFNNGATLAYESAYTNTTFMVAQSSSYKLKAGTTYKFVVGKFA